MDVSESTQQQVERICEKPGSLAKDLAIQLADPSFTDWTLICEDEKIPCHRVILGSRSSVFKVMFEQAGFNESKTLQTQIKVIHFNGRHLKALMPRNYFEFYLNLHCYSVLCILTSNRWSKTTKTLENYQKSTLSSCARETHLRLT